jgi:hypothetical protein
VGLLDALLGRTRPVRPDLDRLFGLPGAAVTLEAGAGFRPAGAGSVCFSRVEGGAFTRLEGEVRDLLDSGAGPGGSDLPVTFSRDAYGYTWILVRRPAEDTAGLVNDLHAVNTLLEEADFGSRLLCSLVVFTPAGESGGSEPGAGPPESGADARRLALVYLYKRGTFYPFAPVGGGAERRDGALELQVRALLTDDLPMERDPGRWFPLWGAPGLTDGAPPPA